MFLCEHARLFGSLLPPKARATMTTFSNTQSLNTNTQHSNIEHLGVSLMAAPILNFQLFSRGCAKSITCVARTARAV